MLRHPAPVLLVALGLAACADTDFDRPYTWQADGINDRNLRAMIVDPAHLDRGVGAATDRGQQGAAAVRALEAGARPALPAGLSDIGGSGGGAAGVSQGGGGGGGGGGGR
ncbi:hypothetical protein J5Y09_12355 [Roseomonas sp. PWR1]|uniref:DUF4136 domain-containing protein n=1 Tax=Roseomonas nitratireducens TaxID=2820810 RepID=A0ABS4ATL2_9PROT|nr:hypothetical protein [Neoroseomonas nitratireducens]MBP0464703.1 hypothetical protein [Neoroseomonas nitratireducens]